MLKDVEEMQVIANALVDSSKHNLEVEVFHTAMLYLKTNPNASITEAINCGLDQWIK